MRLINQLLIALLLVGTGSQVVLASTPERGWWWGIIEQLLEQEESKPEDEEKRETILPVEPPQAAEQDCTDPEQWTVECGFTDPEGDFAFQSAQQEALLNHATMNPGDPQAVEGFQRYMRWAINQSITLARVWEWNMVQNQELNPRIHSPVSAFGLRAAAQVEQEHQQGVLAEIKEQGGFLVWFTRASCPYCHDMRETVLRIARTADLEAWNAALDGQCMEGFESLCRHGDQVIAAAQHLNVGAVPDLWLHLPQDDVWIRISSGIESVNTVVARMELFFGAVRRAAAEGIEGGQGVSPAVDFSIPKALERSRSGAGVGIPQILEQ